MKVEERAKLAAGNWRQIENLLWSAEPLDGERWALIATTHRNANLVDQANAAVIEREICEVFEDDAHVERFQDWLTGWSESMALRVYDAKGEITPAFQAYAKLAERMEGYPLLDETLYSEMEADRIDSIIEMAIEHLPDVELKTNLPEGWVREVWRALDDYESDIRGEDWWPKTENLKTVLGELGYMSPAPASEIEA